MTHSPGTQAHWFCAHWHCAPEPHCASPPFIVHAMVQKVRLGANVVAQMFALLRGAVDAALAELADAQLVAGIAGDAAAARSACRCRSCGVEPRMSRAPGTPPHAAARHRCRRGRRRARRRRSRAAACDTPPREQRGAARADAACCESYDKCLTPPIARFTVLNKCPVCFLALNFSVAVTRKIAEEVERRKAAMADAGFRVAWVPAANLHLTLALPRLGRRGAGRGRDRRRAGAWRRAIAPFEAQARSGSARFRRLQKPSVLWVGVEAPPQLAALQREVDAAMVDLGFEKEERAVPPACHRRAREGVARLRRLIYGRATRSSVRARSAKSWSTRARPARPVPSTSRARGSRSGD